MASGQFGCRVIADLKVIFTAPEVAPRARELAARLAWELSADQAADGLMVTSEGLALQLGDEVLAFDFASAQHNHRRRFGGGYGQAIARACLLKTEASPSIIDATAGSGQDAFVLAGLGAHVTLLERSAVIAVLLEDAIARALQVAEIAAIAGRMQLHQIEAGQYLKTLPGTHYPDVVYLDPMYPASPKSALKAKAMRLFRTMVGNDEDAGAILELAQRRCTQRVVVKRPRKAPWLAGRQPSGAIKMKNTRFDIYPSQVI